jgi:DNA primase large subunit
MLALGQDEIAKYPFLADAGQYLKDQGFSLEQFGSDPDLKQLIDKAYERIRMFQKKPLFQEKYSLFCWQLFY